MPQMRVRMSASSSTTSMSCAMGSLPLDTLGLAGLGNARIGACELQGHARAAAVAVLETQLAAVVLHDLLDDRQTEAGAAGARRHVGLGEPVALLMRQPDAIVLDHDANGALGIGHADADAAWRRAGAARLDRLGGVLQDVDQRLADLATVATEADRLWRQRELEADLGAGGALQKDRAADQLGHVLVAQHRRR